MVVAVVALAVVAVVVGGVVCSFHNGKSQKSYLKKIMLVLSVLKSS